MVAAAEEGWKGTKPESRGLFASGNFAIASKESRDSVAFQDTNEQIPFVPTWYINISALAKKQG